MRALANAPHLQVLQLFGCPIFQSSPHRTASELESLLKFPAQLRVLRLNQCKLETLASLQLVALAVKSAKMLEDVMLRWNQMPASGLNLLLKSLGERLKRLDLFECELEQDSTEPICEFIESHTHLNVLHLGNNRLGDSVIQLLAPLASLKSLRHLLLGHRFEELPDHVRCKFSSMLKTTKVTFFPFQRNDWKVQYVPAGAKWIYLRTVNVQLIDMMKQLFWATGKWAPASINFQSEFDVDVIFMHASESRRGHLLLIFFNWLICSSTCLDSFLLSGVERLIMQFEWLRILRIL